MITDLLSEIQRTDEFITRQSEYITTQIRYIRYTISFISSNLNIHPRVDKLRDYSTTIVSIENEEDGGDRLRSSERRGERAHDGHSRIHSRERSAHGRLAPNADEKDTKRMRMKREEEKGRGEK